MVDWSKISGDLAGRIKEIINSEGGDPDEAVLNKPKEYDQLQALLSGMDKKDPQKGFVEGMIKDYEEAEIVRDNVKKDVLERIKLVGEKMQAEDFEKEALKKYLKDNKDTLTKVEVNWIKDVINGRVVKDLPTEKNNGIAEVDEGKITEQEQNKTVPNKTSENANVIPGSVENLDRPLDIPNKKPANNEGGISENPDRPLDIPNKKPNKDKGETKPPVFGPTKPTPKNSGKETPVVPVPVPVPVPVAPAPHVVDNDRVDDKDHFDDKDGVDNKGAFQQGGVGNVNVGPGGTVIINGGAPVGFNPPNNGHGEPIPPSDKSDGAENTKSNGLSPEEIKEARDDGKVVGDALLGHTSNTEQRAVQDIVDEEVNSGNVLEFLRGYEKELKQYNLWVGAVATKGDHFFEQMRTENNFPEQQDLMRKVAEDLQGYLANKYGVDSDIAKEVAVILLENTLGKEQTKSLDKIYQKELGMEQDTRAPQYRNPVTGAVQLGIDAVKKLTE